MIQNKSQNIYFGANNINGYAMSKFLQTGKFKWIDPKDFDLNTNTTKIFQKVVFSKLLSNIQKNCVN